MSAAEAAPYALLAALAVFVLLILALAYLTRDDETEDR